MVTSQGWRDIPHSRRSPAKRLARLAVAAALLALVGWFIMALVSPFQHPNTHFVYAIAGDDPVAGVAPPPYALEQYAHLTPLKTSLAKSGDNPPMVELMPLSTIGIGNLAQTPLGESIDANDAVLIYVSANEGESQPVPSTSPSNEASPPLSTATLRIGGLADGSIEMPVTQVIDQVRRLPGRTKLLILDTSTNLLADRGTVLPGTFTRQVATAVQQTGDPTLWVLTSHSMLEMTHRSPALHRTVFAYFVARGLKGDADLDGDQLIDTDELLVYVRGSVADWVRQISDGFTTQTPQLLWGGGGPDTAWPSVPLLSVGSVPEEAREGDVQDSLAEARQPRERGKWENVFRERAANRMRPLINPVRDKLTEARVPEITSELRGLEANSGSKAAKPSSEKKDGKEGEPAKAPAPSDAVPENQTGSPQPNDADDPSDSDASGIEPTDPLQDVSLLDQLAQAWSIHDQLTIAQGQSPRPLDYAPDLWWDYRQQLLAVDESIRCGLRFETRPLSRLLTEELLPMATLLDSATVAKQNSDRLVDRFLRRRPTIALASDLGSLALLEATDSSHQRWNESERKAIDQYAQLIDQELPDGFLKWIEESWQDDFQRITELRLAKQFASLAATDWALVQKLLRTAIVGERAAVSVASLAPLQDDLKVADSRRRDAERWMLDQLKSDWRSAAGNRLAAAEASYMRLLEIADARLRLDRLTNELLADLPFLIALQRHAHADLTHPLPRSEDLHQVLGRLASLSIRISEDTYPADLQNVARQLQALLEDLRRGFNDSATQRLVQGPIRSSDAWYMSLVLQTPLLSAQSRMKWIAVVGEIEAVSLQDYSPPTAVALNAQRAYSGHWQNDPARPTRLANLQRQANHWVRWQSMLLEIADPIGPSDDGDSAEVADPDKSLLTRSPLIAPSVRQTLSDWVATPRSIDEFSAAYDQLRTSLTNDHEQWPVRLVQWLEQSSDLSDAPQRDERRSRLHQTQLAIRTVVPALSDLFDPGAVAMRIDSAERYDQFVWQADRDREAIAESLPTNLELHLASAQRYRSLAAAETMQPSLSLVPTPAIAMEATESIVFSPQESEISTDVTIVNRSREATEVWLVVQFDPRYINLHSERTPNVYEETALRDELNWLVRDADDELQLLVSTSANGGQQAEQAGKLNRLRQAARYPFRPDVADLPPTLKLQPGESQPVTLTLLRQDQVGNRSKVVVRALTATDHSRSDVSIRLPDRTAVAIAIQGDPQTWTTEGTQPTLHPYPNRATSYRISLHNTRGSDFDAMVSVVAPVDSMPLNVPETMLPASAADHWLNDLSTVTLVSPRPITLPADARPVELLPSPPLPPKGSDSEAAVAPDAVPSDSAEPTDAEPTDAEAPAISITHGLLVVIRDAATGTTAILPIQCSPQRPRRYVQPRVRYDAAVGKLVIDVEAVKGFVVPAEGIPIQARLSDDAEPGVNLTLAGRLHANETNLRLSADIPTNDDTQLLVELDVDQFPRAFLYRLRPTNSQPSVSEWTDRSRVVITSPIPGKAFASPAEPIEVEARVDAPVGSFLNPRDQFAIGIDADRDREFRDESPLVLRSDRQVRIGWQPPKAPLPPGTGTFDIVSEVSDFKLPIPAGTLADARVNLLGHLRTGQTEVWSDPVEIVLDGQPPRLGAVRVLPSRSVVEEKPLEVSVAVDDEGLSGVAEVKIGFAVTGTTSFSEVPPAVKATLTPSGAWATTLPTSGLIAGTHTMLLQATDVVGNVGPPTSISLRIRSAAEMEAEAQQPKLVSGRVAHGKTPGAGAKVDLFTVEETPRLIATRVANAAGEFRFAKVAPGSYMLKSNAFVRNHYCSGEQEVVVPEGNKTIQPIQIMIE
ncbi:hypothetical protein Pla52o_29820 [Novipirellula galeiformis]|uniref:Cna protein B-type domain protein n=1 Tax=Novipirellula galeiformis TaxID=2528004 RepID=A0A5C6CK14_9BACT|nr:hypothetical protein [Novipirellula galeiformis]TWU23446.1 hypothetical protein Pla52o_29820 [Novipirellula galeiformis]